MPAISLDTLLEAQRPILAEGSVYELLRRSPRVQFDAELAHAALIFDPSARDVLSDTHSAYCDIAAKYGLPIVTFTDTWRANPERTARSAYANKPVNRANAEFLCELRAERSTAHSPIFVAGLIGCRGDAYRPQEALSTEAAAAFHRQQVDELSRAGVDLLFAATLPALSEARGMAIAMAETGLPFVLSFVINRHGQLLDGVPIDSAVESIDTAVSRPALGYFINCVHPDVVLESLDSSNAMALRHCFIGFQANASALSPTELDRSEDLQTQQPALLAQKVIRVAKECSMSILGGCCGTDTEHIEWIAQSMAVTGSVRPDPI